MKDPLTPLISVYRVDHLIWWLMCLYCGSRIIAFRKAEKDEENRARLKIRQKLEEDKVLYASILFICQVLWVPRILESATSWIWWKHVWFGAFSGREATEVGLASWRSKACWGCTTSTRGKEGVHFFLSANFKWILEELWQKVMPVLGLLAALCTTETSFEGRADARVLTGFEASPQGLCRILSWLRSLVFFPECCCQYVSLLSVVWTPNLASVIRGWMSTILKACLFVPSLEDLSILRCMGALLLSARD